MAEVANAGIVRPPRVYLCAIVVGLALEVAWPTSLAPGGRAARHRHGGRCAVLRARVRALRGGHLGARESPDDRDRPHGSLPSEPEPHLRVVLPLQLGLAVSIDSAWVLATLIPAAALIAYVVCRARSDTARRLGSEYGDYKAAVRRWL
jgi:hypothetical protein